MTWRTCPTPTDGPWSGTPKPHRADPGDRRRQLCRLRAADLGARALADALAAYGDDHADSSLRGVLSTWRGFCRWLVAEGELVSDPSAHIEGPGRPDWKPKALELVELGRVIDAASSSDPRSRDPWPERDRALVAVFAGAGVRVGEAISLRVNDVEARDRSPGCGSTARAVGGGWCRWAGGHRGGRCLPGEPTGPPRAVFGH